MGVVKLYLTEATSKHKAWVERATGVASLTKDYARKSYFIQIFDMQHYVPVNYSYEFLITNSNFRILYR